MCAPVHFVKYTVPLPVKIINRHLECREGNTYPVVDLHMRLLPQLPRPHTLLPCGPILCPSALPQSPHVRPCQYTKYTCITCEVWVGHRSGQLARAFGQINYNRWPLAVSKKHSSDPFIGTIKQANCLWSCMQGNSRPAESVGGGESPTDGAPAGDLGHQYSQYNYPAWSLIRLLSECKLARWGILCSEFSVSETAL